MRALSGNRPGNLHRALAEFDGSRRERLVAYMNACATRTELPILAAFCVISFVAWYDPLSFRHWAAAMFVTLQVYLLNISWMSIRLLRGDVLSFARLVGRDVSHPLHHRREQIRTSVLRVHGRMTGDATVMTLTGLLFGASIALPEFNQRPWEELVPVTCLLIGSVFGMSYYLCAKKWVALRKLVSEATGEPWYRIP